MGAGGVGCNLNICVGSMIESGGKALSRCLTGKCIFQEKEEQMRVRVGGWVVSKFGEVTQKTGQTGGLVAAITLAHTALYRQFLDGSLGSASP